MQTEMEGVAGSPAAGGIDLLKQIYRDRVAGGKPNAALERRIVSLVLEHARRVVAHPSRPQNEVSHRFTEYPFGELDLEETLEEFPDISRAEDAIVKELVPRPFSCVAMLDTSSSMSGEKHLLASVAIAVLLLELSSRDASVVVFASDAFAIKKMLTEEQVETTILRFLRSQPRGFTNIRKGLMEGLVQAKKLPRRRRIGLIATDGRATEGGDPAVVAEEYDFLAVLHLHGPGSHLEGSKLLANRGKGVCLEVEEFSELPRRMYEAVRLLARR